jgi:microcystin-dependent protein
MAEPFLAEIRMFGFNFAPRSWATCDGQILPINQNQSRYSLLGTTYGGDGRTSFALPDLRGRTAIHPGANGVSLGGREGEEQHSLTVQEMAAHGHPFQALSGAADDDAVEDMRPARSEGNLYGGGTLVDMGSQAMAPAGSDQGHENMQPYLVVTFTIALQGTFPSRN